MAEEMRTCKTCGETKPLETGFYKNRIGDDSKVYYRHDCKRCWNKAMSERNKQRVKKTETVAEEMRTCKTCGETKPLDGFHIANRRNPNRSYYKSCKTCRNKETSQKQAERRAAEKIEFSTHPASIRDAVAFAHAACPILGIGLWTNPSPARECA